MKWSQTLRADSLMTQRGVTNAVETLRRHPGTGRDEKGKAPEEAMPELTL